jgi:O-acetyl-ADP-ribose deacetylase (regulator of RNase III)
MAIQYSSGDMLTASVDALVNPVNTQGVMGKGLALQFKMAFSDNFAAYDRACKAGAVQVGKMHVVQRRGSPRFIINFPTKEHWRLPSKLEYVRNGLHDLVRQVRRLGIESVAVPALGCGLGGLRWSAVQPLIVGAFEAVPNVRVVLFEPPGVQRDLVQRDHSRSRGLDR